MNPLLPDWALMGKRIVASLEQPMLDIFNGQRRLCGLPLLTLDEYHALQLQKMIELNEQSKAILELIRTTSQDDVMQGYVEYLYRKE